ncbi:MAG: hypothetical protein RL065_440 [Bacteroidota bacterium]|jgi:cobalt-zinc-cadmium efflux system membrane fusion protein
MHKIYLIVALIALASCHTKNNSENNSEKKQTNESTILLTNEQQKTIGVESEKLKVKNISTTIKLTGKIDVPPQNMVSVSMPLGGYLKSTKLLPGMHVTQGEVIATMEDQQYIQLQENYLTAKAKLEFLELEFNRQKDLNKNKASSDKVFQQANLDYNTQKIALSALQEKLKLINVNPQNLVASSISKSINVYSPITGYVSKVDVNIGKYVNPSDVLFELVNPDDIHLNLQVLEKDVDKLSIGQKMWAYNNQQPKKRHPCEIILLGRDLTSEGITEVHCHFEDYDKTLLPGMYMNADVELKNNNVMAIDENAVVRFEGKEYVFIEEGNRQYNMQEVETGITENGFTEVKNTEKFKNKLIVVKGSYALLMAFKNKEEE